MPAPLTPPLQDLIAAWLAAQQAGDIYGLTRRPVLSPPGIPNLVGRGLLPPPTLPPTGPPGVQPPTTAPPAGTQPQIGGGEPAAAGEPPGWGRMDPGMEIGLGLGGLALGLLGSPLGLGLGALAGISRAIGGPEEPNPYAEVPSVAQIQQAQERRPQDVPEMVAQRQAVTDALAAEAARMQSQAMKSFRQGERTGIAPGVSSPENPPGFDVEGGKSFGPSTDVGVFGGPSGSLAGGFEGISEGRGKDTGGMSDVGGEAGMAGGEPGGEGTTGGESSGDTDGRGEGMYRRGGVRVFRRPTRVLAGEAGREVGIFIPQRMLRPGIQGPERSVLKALESFAKQLRKQKGKDKGGK